MTNKRTFTEDEKIDLILGLIHSKYHMDAGSDDINERDMAKIILKVCDDGVSKKRTDKHCFICTKRKGVLLKCYDGYGKECLICPKCADGVKV